jgi:hypothetical protein
MTKKLNHLDLANYVVGWLVHGDPVTVDGARQALQIALNQLDDYQDGLEAVAERDPDLRCLTQCPEIEWEENNLGSGFTEYRSDALISSHRRIITTAQDRATVSGRDRVWRDFNGPRALDQAKAFVQVEERALENS